MVVPLPVCCENARGAAAAAAAAAPVVSSLRLFLSIGLRSILPKRNLERFPGDFVFQLHNQEVVSLKSQLVISKPPGRGGRRSAPYAFTEHGALMAVTVLNSPRAVEMSLYVVRAFMRLREMLATHKELAKKLEALEKKAEELALKHDALAATTRAQFKEVIDTLRALMTSPEPKKRPIGFIIPEEK
jgi:phage regulator Rha-like protein